MQQVTLNNEEAVGRGIRRSGIAREALFVTSKIRALGVANFQPDRITDLMIHNTVAPAGKQIEVNPFLQQPDAQRFLQANGVQTEA